MVEVETTQPPVGLLAFAAAVEKALSREHSSAGARVTWYIDPPL